MSSLADLLASNPHLRLQPNNKILCEVTGHEMPPQLAAVQSHVGGKKYKKALEWYRHDFSVHEPLIIQHKSKAHKLFCTLTQEELNKIPDQVKKHVEGKRFQRLKQIATTDKERKPAAKQAFEKDPDENPDFWIPEAEEVEDEADSEDEEDSEEEEEEEQPIHKSSQGQKRKSQPTVEENDDEEDLNEVVIVRQKGKGKKVRKILSTL